MDYYNNITELIGNTPLLKLNNFSIPAPFNVFTKLEYLNPGGSIKDRIGLQMLQEAERAGQLDEDTVIIEPTAGNTGIGLALAAKNKGNKVILIVPDKFSQEKHLLMEALGAEIVSTPAEDGIKGAKKKAQEIAANYENSFIPDQFSNKANPQSHYLTTGPEIYAQLEGEIDYFVAGGGTGGTFSGTMRYLKEQDPAIKGILIEPHGSIFSGGEKGSYEVEGIGNSFVPETLDLELATDILKVSDQDSFAQVRKLARLEGITVGSSSGASLAGVLKLISNLQEDKKSLKEDDINIVTVFFDGSERYFSKNIYDKNKFA